MDKTLKLEDLFNTQEKLKLALTHKSWVNEHPGKGTSNERLEFLGDAILEYIVSKEIYKLFPDKEEGFLTALRANLVNTVNLSQLALKLGVGKSIFLSKGEEDGGGRSNPSILADTIEAIIGGIFLDSGVDKAEEFVKETILSEVEDKIAQPLKDPKSRLQEIVQAKGLPAPRYEVISESGPDHNKQFTIQVVVDGKSLAQGEGKNKSEAAQNAALAALDVSL